MPTWSFHFLTGGSKQLPARPTGSGTWPGGIDAGMAVVGGHPHVTQTVEIYKGRPIVYSLGNFVFDYYPKDPAVWTGWFAQFTVRRSGEIDLETFVSNRPGRHPAFSAGRPSRRRPPEQRELQLALIKTGG